jgi:hypothetical protein
MLLLLLLSLLLLLLLLLWQLVPVSVLVQHGVKLTRAALLSGLVELWALRPAGRLQVV